MFSGGNTSPLMITEGIDAISMKDIDENDNHLIEERKTGQSNLKDDHDDFFADMRKFGSSSAEKSKPKETSLLTAVNQKKDSLSRREPITNPLIKQIKTIDDEFN